MKTLFFLSIFLLFGSFGVGPFANADCETPKYSCQCFQNVPFEGYIMYVVEKCGTDEQWIQMDPRPRGYSDMNECSQAIKADEDCQKLDTFNGK